MYVSVALPYAYNMLDSEMIDIIKLFSNSHLLTIDYALLACLNSWPITFLMIELFFYIRIFIHIYDVKYLSISIIDILYLLNIITVYMTATALRVKYHSSIWFHFNSCNIWFPNVIFKKHTRRGHYTINCYKSNVPKSFCSLFRFEFYLMSHITLLVSGNF